MASFRNLRIPESVLHGVIAIAISFANGPSASAKSTQVISDPNKVPTKKTACTVTINSSEEANAFREHLSRDQWNFVELTNPNSTSVQGWFKNACEKQISCDILIFSGHFGGAFFGMETDLRLSMEELESASCQSSCKGITKQPKEVFLFGCNTLAGKEKDTRTPEQYQRVLIADGFSASQASQIAAFRYSAFGDSFRGRMAQVFSQTHRIYGFSALAPSGVTAEPFLRRYLDRNRTFYIDFEHSSEQLGIKQNSALKTAFSATTLTQVPGLMFTIDAVNGKSERRETPYCFLGADTNTRLAKLRYIKNELHAGRAFTFISHIDKFLNETIASDSQLTPDETIAIREIARDPTVKRNFEKYLRLPGDVYAPVRVSVLNLMASLGLITQAEHGGRVMKTLALDFNRPITRQIADRICSFDVRVDIEMPPDARWSEYETYTVLRCLRPKNPMLHRRLADILTNPKDKNAFNASWTLAALPVTDPTVHRQIADAAIGVSESDPDTRRYAIDTLSGINPTDTAILRELAHTMKSDPDWSMRQEAAYAFRTISTNDQIVLETLVDVMLHDEVWGIRSAAADALQILNPSEASIQKYRKTWEGRIL